jgi:hypothetical protein
MAKRIKTEHAGAKNGGGHFGKREEAKRLSRKSRREMAKDVVAKELTCSSSDSK